MTKSQIERKVRNLKKKLMYYYKVYPRNDERIKVLKSEYRHYKNML